MRMNLNIKRCFSALLISAVSVCAFAQTEGQMTIGYSGRNITTSSDWGLDEAGLLSTAIKLDPAYIGSLSGLRVSGVCAGLASRLNVASIKVWVRSSLDGENLAELEASPKKGWNDLYFATPCPIEGSECYVGYTLQLSDMSYPVSVVPGSSPYGFYLNKGNGWETPVVDVPSVLSLLAVIEADNLPQYSLRLSGATIPSRMKIGSPAPVSLQFENMGCRTLTGANIRFYENGVKGDLYSVPFSIAPGYTGIAEVEYLPIGNSRMNDCELRMVIESLAEGEDENVGDNEWSGIFNLCKFDFLKRVFLEEYTTQRCSNCPRAASMIHELISMPQYEGRIVICARHSGFGTDKFTSDTDLEMLDMYGSDGTFCPAIMLDRTAFYSDGVPVMSVPMDMSGLTPYVDECLANMASVDIVANATYDTNSNKLKVSVSGGRDAVFGNTPARVSVYLVENDIYDTIQTGTDGDYWQQHVVRAVDSTWGTVIEWNDEDEFVYECLLDPSKVADTANTEIVAVVHDYDPNDISNRVVNNAFSTKTIEWNGFTGNSGSDGVVADAVAVSVEYFDLQGRKINVSDCTSGIILKKTSFSDNSVKVEKFPIR